jgi:hypothetical protein
VTSIGHQDRTQRPFLPLYGVVALVAAGLLLYSQTLAFAWDEGFHLLAAQLIKAGRKPYLDFCFSQTPNNAYWNAGWMWIFGESWRTAHAVAALLTAGAVLLTAQFILSRFPVPGWRRVGALVAAVLVGFNAMVLEYGTIGQAYGLCLFLMVAAFRLSVETPDRTGWFVPASAGFLACAAANSSLLTATVAPVLLVWILIHNRAGSRWIKFAAFASGGVIAFLPLVWLFAQNARAVWFGIFEYNGLYRQVDWPGATRQNIEVLTYWIDSSQALALGLLAVLGTLFIAKSDWDRERRAEFYLCGWLAVATAAELCVARPTFQRYFLFVVPFLAILAIAGLYAITLRMHNPDRPAWPVLVLTVLTALGLFKSIYERGAVYSWQDMENAGRKVNEVTPAQGTVWADEQIYFVTGLLPPTGMELADSHKFELLPAELAAALHVVPKSQLERRVKAGEFDTVATFADADTMDELGLPKTYAKRATVGDCDVFWERVANHAVKSGQPERSVTSSSPLVGAPAKKD